jgi:hypothetical protein
MWTTLQAEVVSRLPQNGFNGTQQKGVATLQLHGNDQDGWKKRIDKLEVFRTYQKNWDGQGAEAPTEELLQSAIQLANILRQAEVVAPSCVVPGVNGTIVFEWQSEDSSYLEIEVTEPYHADAFLMVPGGRAEHWSFQ